MEHRNKIKYSKTAINTQLSTRKSEVRNTDLQIYDEQLNEISLSDIPKASLTYKGAFPYLVEALSELCTINPKLNGEFVIKGQEDRNSTHYSALIKWKTLVELATKNEPLVKDGFRKEIMNIYKKAPSLYLNLGNGHGLLTHPFIIRSIVFDDLSTMTKKEAEACIKLGITKTISYVDIEFFKPLFNACFPGKEKGGFIYTDPAFYTMLQKTIHTMKQNTDTSKRLSRFYNPRTKQFVTKYPSTYYKFVLWLLTHISSNEKANSLTLNEEDLIDLLAHVDPGQLIEKNGKNYIKNPYDTKLFFDKACWIYNQMGKYGYSEKTIAVGEHSIYSRINGKLQIIINYVRENPRTNIDDYTSNFMNEIEQNPPLEIEFKEQENI